jgi:hypothetical protein
MFNTEERENDYVIRHKPNKIILFIEVTRWYWIVAFFLVAFSLYIILGPTPIEQEYSLENYLSLVLVSLAILLLPFYVGIKLGANLYRPHKSALTEKQLKSFDQLLALNEGDIKVSFIRKNGKIEVIGEE